MVFIDFFKRQASNPKSEILSGITVALALVPEAVVVVALVTRHGVEYLFAAVVLMGLLQITAGLLRLGKFIRLVPQAAMFGFVNGLAIVIALAQLVQFKATDASGSLHWISGKALGNHASVGGRHHGYHPLSSQAD